jgi:hypothetical protein
MSPDLINGLFELAGAIALGANVLKLLRDRQVRGVHWASTVFFTSWGFWNLIYYPTLGQWFSLAGGACIVIVNMIWLLLVATCVRS